MIALLLACNEQELTSTLVSLVAVTAGDFDDVSEPLARMNVQYVTYDGIIRAATWNPDLEHEGISLDVETLFTEPGEMEQFDAVFVASGTRGMGVPTLTPAEDDFLVADPVVIENVREFVRLGGVVVFTDWSYDLFEAAWPDAVHFLYEPEVDGAQRGEPDLVTASIQQPSLQEALGSNAVAISLNYSNWAVMEDTADERVTVWLRGPATSSVPEGGLEVREDVPLLVSLIPEGSTGKAVFSSFHLDVQRDDVTDTLLRTVVGSFRSQPSSETGP